MKLKIGIIFGGPSREREVSFAGGRTVYDNLDKSLFEAVPVFVDSFCNFWLLNWEFIYKGSIRDFYPADSALPEMKHNFQLYAENLGALSIQEQEKLLNHAGKRLNHEELKDIMDIAFLALHGSFGEDGKIQGMFEFLSIPYTGSGIFPSAIGIDKVIQRGLMEDAGFAVPKWFSVERNEWSSDPESVYQQAEKEVGFPLVVKSATQGSSIGVTIVQEGKEEFFKALERGFFVASFTRANWNNLSEQERFEKVRTVSDIREGIGMPVIVGVGRTIYNPEELLDFLTEEFNAGQEEIHIQAADGEQRVMIESFIEGKEFSCIVLQDESERPVALPPTEIRKGKELFDYRSKYLPGLSRKITPIDIAEEKIEKIRHACERLFNAFGFDVYARIDGFITSDDTVYLNDPNTTSGMMPSSFFFHQAAEIGLNPSQFLTYIVETSLTCRMKKEPINGKSSRLKRTLETLLQESKENVSEKLKVAVLLGGYSSERHISVESGRNIYEKLSSSEKYEPVPVFVTGDDNAHKLFRIPVNVLLKDNADDIIEKIGHYSVHPVVEKIIKEANDITGRFGRPGSLAPPTEITYNDLASEFDAVFIALHGRPGEDGAVQERLIELGIPFNGSEVESSRITINKFETNEILKQNGFLVAEHRVVEKQEWEKDPNQLFEEIEKVFDYPFIAKPVDDGCSSAVKKIKSRQELEAFAKLIFRPGGDLHPDTAAVLHLKPKEEFPCKSQFLIEELITKKDATHFLEITGGLLTRFNDQGDVEYEMFEASEALTEGEVLSLEEKFLAGQGQNITPARYSRGAADRQKISDTVKETLKGAARVLNIQGYARIDAFVRIYSPDRVEVIFVEVNSLPGMTPATCIFHQTAINGYKPYDFIDQILQFGMERKRRKEQIA